MGVPIIGCQCVVCLSTSPYDQRLRPSVLLKVRGKQFLIDIGLDYRTQALRYQINTLDGVLLTHTHYDHIAGLDELRIYAFRKKKGVPCLMSKETLEELKVRYHYLFPSDESGDLYKAKLSFQELEGKEGETSFEGLQVRYFSYTQMGMSVTGFRFGNLAYVTDIFEYDVGIFEQLEGVDTLIISAIGWEQSKAHLSMEEVMEFAKKAGVKKTYLTHLSHEVHYEKTLKKLPRGFALAYDGMEISL